jgi:hypothetical protein
MRTCKKLDIQARREDGRSVVGSGNIGATNVLRTAARIWRFTLLAGRTLCRRPFRPAIALQHSPFDEARMQGRVKLTIVDGEIP